jgi:hypothetical protein
MRALFAVIALAACGLANAATCIITEFAERPPVTYQAAYVPYLASSSVTYTTSSVQSSVFNVNTALVRIQCDAMRLAANTAEYFAVTPAASPPYTSLRLAVIGP